MKIKTVRWKKSFPLSKIFSFKFQIHQMLHFPPFFSRLQFLSPPWMSFLTKTWCTSLKILVAQYLSDNSVSPNLIWLHVIGLYEETGARRAALMMCFTSVFLMYIMIPLCQIKFIIFLFPAHSFLKLHLDSNSTALFFLCTFLTFQMCSWVIRLIGPVAMQHLYRPAWRGSSFTAAPSAWCCMNSMSCNKQKHTW